MDHKKLSKEWIQNAIKEGEFELHCHKPGSKTWLLIYEQLEIIRGWLK